MNHILWPLQSPEAQPNWTPRWHFRQMCWTALSIIIIIKTSNEGISPWKFMFIPPIQFHRLEKNQCQDWSYSSIERWPNTLLRYFMLNFPSVSHSSVFLMEQRGKCTIKMQDLEYIFVFTVSLVFFEFSPLLYVVGHLFLIYEMMKCICTRRSNCSTYVLVISEAYSSLV